MKRLAGMFQFDIKKYILIIVVIIFLKVLIAQPIKLTLELKGAGSTGDTFLLYEPIYPILTVKNTSPQNQKIIDFRIQPLQMYSLKRLLISEDNGKPIGYNPIHIDFLDIKKEEENYRLILSPGDSIVTEIGELLRDFSLLNPGSYRMSVSWRDIESNEVRFVVEEPKGDSVKAYDLYKEAVIISDYPLRRLRLTEAEREAMHENRKKMKQKKDDWELVNRLKKIMKRFKKDRITVEPYFVLTHEVFKYAVHSQGQNFIKAGDTAKALELYHDELKRFIEEHPNTYLAQRRVKQRGAYNRVLPKWEDDENYNSWLQYLTENYLGTLVGNEAKGILESKKEKSKK